MFFFFFFFFLYLKESRQGGYFDTTILLIGKILNKSCWNEVNTINQKQRENTEVYNTVSCYKDCDKIIVIYNLGSLGFLFWSFSNISCFSEAALFMALAFEMVALMSNECLRFCCKGKLICISFKLFYSGF